MINRPQVAKRIQRDDPAGSLNHGVARGLSGSPSASQHEAYGGELMLISSEDKLPAIHAEPAAYIQRLLELADACLHRAA